MSTGVYQCGVCGELGDDQSPCDCADVEASERAIAEWRNSGEPAISSAELRSRLEMEVPR